MELISIAEIETLRVPIVSPDHAMVRIEMLDEGYEKRTKWKANRNHIIRAPKQFLSESNQNWAQWLKRFTGLEPHPPTMQTPPPIINIFI